MFVWHIQEEEKDRYFCCTQAVESSVESLLHLLRHIWSWVQLTFWLVKKGRGVHFDHQKSLSWWVCQGYSIHLFNSLIYTPPFSPMGIQGNLHPCEAHKHTKVLLPLFIYLFIWCGLYPTLPWNGLRTAVYKGYSEGPIFEHG